MPESSRLLTPVVFIVFNRPSTTRRVFERIAQARPEKLLIVADGARTEKAGEADGCREVLEIVSHVDWECEVLTNFSPVNLGCGERIISGLNWAFSHVDEAIILEDDCLPDPTFFPLCQELLERYREDRRVASVAGANLVEKYCKGPDSYYFSRLGGIWGWATWKSRWLTYDRYLANWPVFRESNALAELFDDDRACAHWARIFDAMHQGKGPNTWDYQWIYTHLFENRLHIVPRVNLIRNIGFGAGATHTAQVDAQMAIELRQMDFPLHHPAGMVPSRTLDKRFSELDTESFSRRLAKNAARIAKGMLRSTRVEDIPTVQAR